MCCATHVDICASLSYALVTKINLDATVSSLPDAPNLSVLLPVSLLSWISSYHELLLN